MIDVWPRFARARRSPCSASARSGLAAARALLAGGRRRAWPGTTTPTCATRPRPAGVAARRPRRRRLDARRRRWCSARAFRTPARSRIPSPRAARAAGAPIIGDIELLAARAAATRAIVGITGTNGKSTTTALIGHILQPGRPRTSRSAAISARRRSTLAAARRRRHLCAGAVVLPARADRDARRFDVAVLLNITPDHLDRHGGMDGYVAAKRRIFARQGAARRGDDRRRRRASAAASREHRRAPGSRRVVPISAATRGRRRRLRRSTAS